MDKGRHGLVVFLCAIVLARTGFGQNPDSSRYVLPEVIVTATRSEDLAKRIPSPVSVISHEEIRSRPGSLVAAGLSGVPGVFIRSYGGPNSLQTISLRGMAAEHTLVLLDGQRLNSAQNGLVDMGLLSSSNVEKVEVVRGGYSALYGADALGGVINIMTRRPSHDIAGGVVNTLGSNGFSAIEMSASGSGSVIGWRGLVRRERGRGDYEFDFSDGLTTTRLRRNGGDFTATIADGRLDYAISADLNSSMLLTLSDADRGVPGAVTDIASTSRARLSDRDMRAQLTADWKISGEVTGHLGSFFLYKQERYYDPAVLIGGVVTQTSSVNRSIVLGPEVRFAPSAAFTGDAGIEFSRSWVASNEVRDEVRWQRSAFLTTQHAIPLSFEIPFEVLLYPSLRYDSFSDVDGDVSPRFGINIGLLRSPELRLRSSYGKSFRVPSFNDLYWYAGGNPALKPERSLSFDCGLLGSIPVPGTLQADINFFSIRSDDRIVWTPTSGSFWSPRNIRSVSSQGVEVEGRWSVPGGGLVVVLNSTWLTVRKESEDFPGDPTAGKILAYAPEQCVNASVTFHIGGVDLFMQHSWTSFRYTTENNDRFLPGYAVTSAAIQYALPAGPVRASVKLEVTNMFNTTYQVIALYPMPSREFRGTVGVEL